MIHLINTTQYNLCHGATTVTVDIDTTDINVGSYLYKTTNNTPWLWTELKALSTSFSTTKSLYLNTTGSTVTLQVKEDITNGYALIIEVNSICPTQTPTPSQTPTNTPTPTNSPTPTNTRTPTRTPTVTPSSPLNRNLYYVSSNLEDVCYNRSSAIVNPVSLYDRDTTLETGSFLYKNSSASTRWLFSELLARIGVSVTKLYFIQSATGLVSSVISGTGGYAVVDADNIQCPSMQMSDDTYLLCHSNSYVWLQISTKSLTIGNYIYKNNGIDNWTWTELVALDPSFSGSVKLYLKRYDYIIRIEQDIATDYAVITDTQTICPTQTPTPTQTNTPTISLSPTNTATNTPTATTTNTPTNSNTPTRSPTPTNTNTPTTSNTPTNTVTNTPTISVSPTVTPTNTPTQTPSNTSTPTNTPTQSPTPTNTSTLTPTQTPTNTITNTPTISLSPTNTITPSNSNTPTPSVSVSNSPTNTPTCSNSATPTPTATNPLDGVYYYLSSDPYNLCHNDPTTVVLVYDNNGILDIGEILYETSDSTDKWLFSELLGLLNIGSANELYIRRQMGATSTVYTLIENNDGESEVSSIGICVTRTPTPTPTTTQTPTNTETSTPTPTPTPTNTNTPTTSETPTNTPTTTNTPTNTETPTTTPTLTNTSTPSETPTQTPTNTTTPSETPTNTPTPTNTRTSTPTTTVTSTTTVTPSPTSVYIYKAINMKINRIIIGHSYKVELSTDDIGLAKVEDPVITFTGTYDPQNIAFKIGFSAALATVILNAKVTDLDTNMVEYNTVFIKCNEIQDCY